MGNIFFEITIIICLAAFLSIIFRFLKQPPILAYILTGILIGPLNLFHIQNTDLFQNMGQLGIALLLFLLGLELKLSDLRSVGKTVIIGGIFQVFIITGLGFAISLLLGIPLISSFYIGVALTFSSTMMVVKLLADKKDFRSLYGKISIGILLVQDFFAILFLIFLSGYKQESNFSLIASNLSLIILKGIYLTGLIILASKTILPKIIHVIARSQETLFLFSLAWVFGLSALVSSRYIGFSIEIGGFLAGLALANSMENFQIVARMRPLRDFFVTIFFVFLGVEMSVGDISVVIFPSILLSIFILVVKPFITMIIMGILGYRKRTAFFIGMNLAQVSEFSLILIVLANKMGQIPNNIVSLITLTAVITFAFSTYFITKNNLIYTAFSKYIGFLKWKNKEEQIGEIGELEGHVLLIGANHMGQSILDTIKTTNEKLVVVDFDPDVVKKLKQQGVNSIFGDISDVDIQEKAFLHKAKLVISAISDMDDNLILIKAVRHVNKDAKIITMALDNEEAKILYQEGADYVILPHIAGSRQIAKTLKTGEFERLEELREKDSKYIL